MVGGTVAMCRLTISNTSPEAGPGWEVIALSRCRRTLSEGLKNNLMT